MKDLRSTAGPASVQIYAAYSNYRWDGVSNVRVWGLDALPVADVELLLVLAGCKINSIGLRPDGIPVEATASPSPLVVKTLMAAGIEVESPTGDHTVGGLSGEIVPWMDPAVVRAHEAWLLEMESN